MRSEPVMTFQADSVWLGVRVDQMEKVAIAPHLWPVPLSDPGYMGLLDHNDGLVPVFSLATGTGLEDAPFVARNVDAELLVAVLVVRGERVGLLIDRAGRVYDDYELDSLKMNPKPDVLSDLDATLAHVADHPFWMIDADLLWMDSTESPTGQRSTPSLN